jgi:hypothetical protein
VGNGLLIGFLRRGWLVFVHVFFSWGNRKQGQITTAAILKLPLVVDEKKNNFSQRNCVLLLLDNAHQPCRTLLTKKKNYPCSDLLLLLSWLKVARTTTVGKIGVLLFYRKVKITITGRRRSAYFFSIFFFFQLNSSQCFLGFLPKLSNQSPAPNKTTPTIGMKLNPDWFCWSYGT